MLEAVNLATGERDRNVHYSAKDGTFAGALLTGLSGVSQTRHHRDVKYNRALGTRVFSRGITKAYYLYSVTGVY